MYDNRRALGIDEVSKYLSDAFKASKARGHSFHDVSLAIDRAWAGDVPEPTLNRAHDILSEVYASGQSPIIVL